MPGLLSVKREASPNSARNWAGSSHWVRAPKGTARERYLIHKDRFLRPLREFAHRLSWFGEPFACLYYKAKQLFERSR